jgi:hypothetical protein
VSIITTVETAIVAALLAEGITCYAFEDEGLDRVPLATLSFQGTDAGWLDDVDQWFGAGTVRWVLRYYTSMVEGAKEAQDDLKDGALAIVNAIGQDPTLGGKVHRCILGEGRVSQVLFNNQPELVYEVEVFAQMFANQGT